MIRELNKLIEEWKSRRSWFLAYAEEQFFANDPEYIIRGTEIWKGKIRQWDSAIEDLEEVIKNNTKDYQI